jgi:hypothetical protein
MSLNDLKKALVESDEMHVYIRTIYTIHVNIKMRERKYKRVCKK